MTDAKTHRPTRAAASNLILLRDMVEKVVHKAGTGGREGRGVGTCLMEVEV
jgi:hypothetical protein